ncbi:MAG: DUF309 domain-containing protein [Ignavibacteriales bacterium]|nr:DUF309 domain-containing protein [Ignavibacteriales bacterium]
MFDIDEGVHLFNDSDFFFSAHDFFEDIWMEAERDEKLFFQEWFKFQSAAII